MNKVILAVLLFFLMIPASSIAEKSKSTIQVVKGQQLSAAIGHYARARSLMIAAIREFDKGLVLGNPAALIDAKEWRNSVIDRAEDLERILAPQPRATKDGANFSPDSRLLSESFR